MAQGRMAVAPASWSAPAERSGDGAFARTQSNRIKANQGKTLGAFLPLLGERAGVRAGFFAYARFKGNGEANNHTKSNQIKPNQGESTTPILAKTRQPSPPLPLGEAPSRSSVPGENSPNNLFINPLNQPDVRFRQDAGSVSPSPGGEGRGEGELPSNHQTRYGAKLNSDFEFRTSFGFRGLGLRILDSIKPNQTESNQLKPKQFSRRECGPGVT
jgi:hypothetical protein